MPRRYPEATGPKTDTQMMAWLFGMLAGAYSMIDQYERDEDEREAARLRDVLSEHRRVSGDES